MATRSRKLGRTPGRKTRRARRGMKAAPRREEEGPAATGTGPYREFQREYATALWL